MTHRIQNTQTRQARYKKTPKGKKKQAEAVARYQASELGQAALKDARAKYEQSEKARARKREWMKQYRLRKKLEREANSRNTTPHPD